MLTAFLLGKKGKELKERKYTSPYCGGGLRRIVFPEGEGKIDV